MSWIIKILLPLLWKIIPSVTQSLKDELQEFILNLYRKAEATDNPIDDVFVAVLAGILDIELPD